MKQPIYPHQHAARTTRKSLGLSQMQVGDYHKGRMSRFETSPVHPSIAMLLEVMDELNLRVLIRSEADDLEWEMRAEDYPRQARGPAFGDANHGLKLKRTT